MTRVLAIATDAYGAGGGIARYNRDWLAAMEDHQVELLLMTSANVPVRDVPAHVTLRHAAPGRWALVWASLQCLRRDAPDWIWCGHLHLAPVAAVLSWICNVPLWLQVHGIEAWQKPGRLRQRAADRAQLITAVSRHTRRELLRWWRGAPERVRVLPNTVSEVFFRPTEPAESFATPCRERAQPVLLTVGRLSAAERYKGQDRVLRLMPELLRVYPQARYLIAGDGDDRSRLQALADELGLSAHVEFCGHVADGQLPALYRSADIMVMPSTGEGFGIAFLEAMACGTPAIGLRGDGSVDALQDGVLGDCVEESALLASIRHRLEHRRDRAELSASTRCTFGIGSFRRQLKRLVGSWQVGAA